LVPVELLPDRASALWAELASGRRIGVESAFDAPTFERLISLLDKA
jgi:hypothetical protein